MVGDVVIGYRVQVGPPRRMSYACNASSAFTFFQIEWGAGRLKSHDLGKLRFFFIKK